MYAAREKRDGWWREWLPPLVLIVGMGGLFGTLPGVAAQTRAGEAPAFDARALQLLRQMADTYARLPALEQQTEFSSALIPLQPIKAPASPRAPASGGESGAEAGPPPSGETPTLPGRAMTGEQKLKRRLHLMYASPNRLFVELQETNSTQEKPVVSQWISDGKQFWTYSQEKRQYTQEKAPAHIHDFQKLSHLNSGSLELLMLIGLNPFANLQEAVDSVRYAGTETVQGVPTEVVTLRTDSALESTEARLYIGREDSLLRRLVVETTPVNTPAGGTPGIVGDSLDELVREAPPATDAPSPSTAPPMKTRVSYENILTTHPQFGALTFTFNIPKDTTLYVPYDPNSHALTIGPTNQLGDILHRPKKPKSRRPKVLHFPP